MTLLRIALSCPGTDDAQVWAQALQAALLSAGESARITVWPREDAQADFAVVYAADQAFLDAHRNVRAIFRLGAGVDAMLKLTLPSGVPLVRLEDAGMGDQMAQWVCHAVLRHVREFDAYQASAAKGQWTPRPARSAAQFPVGVLGMGALGQRVAVALQALGFAVNGYSRNAKAVGGVRAFLGEAELDAFFSASRIVVCMLPLTPATEGILNRRRMSLLQAPGYVVNVARGAHVVEEDLLALVESGQLAGAALDVTCVEPLPAGHAFWREPRILLTPHISALTLIDESVQQIAHKISALQRGEPISGIVNLARGY